MTPTKDTPEAPALSPKATGLELISDIERVLEVLLDWAEADYDNEVIAAEYEVDGIQGMLGAIQWPLNALRALVTEHVA